MVRVVHQLWLRFLPLQILMITSIVGLIVGVTGAMTILLLNGGIQPAPLPGDTTKYVGSVRPAPAMIGIVFTPEVQYWKDNIKRWSQQYGIDPNILATVIQIESCGDFTVGSNVGAQGLFQVMPFHFQKGENTLDPDTNAKRGIEYLRGGLIRADGHIGLAMAGYNGGWGMIDVGWGGWPRETKLYYLWGSQIYLDAINGKTTEQSSGLQSWLNAGGVNLCKRAHDSLFGTPTPGPGTPGVTATPTTSTP